MLFDNGFSSPEELAVYSTYDLQQKGCNLENRFYVMDDGPGYVHNEYEMLDLIMEVAYGPEGRRWKLQEQQLISGWEPTLYGKEMCPYYADKMTILTPDGKEESFFFDVSAHMLSMEEVFTDDTGGFTEIKS